MREADSSTNPFSTRRIRPGVVEFRLPEGQTVKSLVDRLRQNDWWGEIIGPHGSGKSTLLASIVQRIEQSTVIVELHDGQRRLPLDWKQMAELDASVVLIVDGYEQLGWLTRLRLKRLCRRNRLGLIVTAHESIGLPELFRTDPSEKTARVVVGILLSGDDSLIGDEDIADAYRRHSGNIREMLFDLYDVYEMRRRKVVSA